MKISIIGTGYVGLVTGVCLAELGHQVLCVDRDQDKINKINLLVPVLYETGLKDLLKRNLGTNFRAIADICEAVTTTDVTLITVGTPTHSNGMLDLTSIKKASHLIGLALQEKATYHVVTVKSTVLPGTSDDVVCPILEEASGKQVGIDFGVCTNPEFLREGQAVQDFMFPDRIVLGGSDARAIAVLKEMYSVFEPVDMVVTNNRTAEMIKYVSNALLATMISFSNEIGNLCAVTNVDVVDVMKGVHLDKRLSPILPDGSRIVPSFVTYLAAGCGFGGSCLRKDVRALMAYGERVGEPLGLLGAVIRVNEQQPHRILSILARHFSSLAGVRIAVLGLAFKPGTDDMRESPAIPVIEALAAHGAEIKAYDPVVEHEAAQKLFGDAGISFCDELTQSIENVQAIVLITSWEEFSKLPQLLIHQYPQPLVVDGRRVLSKHEIERYDGIGL
jgi:UDPglucose 6-dehydrogenase